MPRKIAYWAATGLVGIVTLFAGFSYLTSRLAILTETVNASGNYRRIVAKIVGHCMAARALQNRLPRPNCREGILYESQALLGTIWYSYHVIPRSRQDCHQLV